MLLIVSEVKTKEKQFRRKHSSEGNKEITEMCPENEPNRNSECYQFAVLIS